MPPAHKRHFCNNIKQTRKKCKLEADYHVGESSDGSFGLNFFVPDCWSKELPQCWAVDDHVGETSDGSFALDLRVSGFRSEKWAQYFKQVIRQIVQSVNNAHPAPRNLALKTGIQETPTVRDVETTFRNEYELTGDWSELQDDLLVRIAENHLISADDFVMFSSVCRSWYRAAAACNLAKLREKWAHCQMPWIMLTDGNTVIDEDGYSKSDYVLPRVLNDIEEYDAADVEFSSEARSWPRKLYTRCVLDLRRNKSFNIECPEGYGRVCWGSAHGWIVTAGGDGKMFMFNPFTKFRVSLPSFATFRHRWDNEDKIRQNRFVTRAVVLRVGADDDSQNCGDSGVDNLRVVAFYGDDHVAIVKPGNRRWVEIEGGVRSITRLMDVVYDSSVGLIFVDDCGGLLSCILPKNEEESPLLTWIRPPVPSWHKLNEVEFYVGAYIFKCGSDLVIVLRLVDCVGDLEKDRWEDHFHACGHRSDTYMTTFFEVYKFDFSFEDWVEIKDLKDVALFVGNNASMWVDAPSAGCERNCIYYTDDARVAYHFGKDNLGGHDSGVRKMSDPPMGSDTVRWSQPLPVPEGSNTRSSYCCPLWFRPSVCAPKGLN